ncbi:Ankyrin repeat domain-containing protein 13C [Podila minutissima]|uniref:Ankyrin repeat domain-containing protein 13C n=1 Tax=Podila minutissima TaxID=64525 RepID=A0A9P5VHX5_9FUNG|nr:Ankyrin repeat domain-containing protein 13C [Podila minutissima]
MATIIVDPADPLALHKLIYLNKVQTLKMFLAPYAQHSLTADATGADGNHDTHPQKHSQHHPQINTLDHHLLAPLHLAVMLNRKEAVSLLLKAGANPMARSGTGWTPRQEAISLGDRSLIELLTRHQRKEFSGSFKQKATNLVKQLSNDLDQFYFQLQWEFQSWVPFVSGLCPNDTYHIWKKGNAVRMDTSLVGFENMKWLRGHISIIFRVDAESGPELVIVDRVKKITQRLARSSDEEEQHQQEATDEEIEDEVSICFNSDITSTNVPTSAIKFNRAKAGIWGYRTFKTEKVGEFECAVWKMDGVEFRTRVRTEHLKDEFGKPIIFASGRGRGRGRGRGGHGHHGSGLGHRGRGGKHGHGLGIAPRRQVHQPLAALDLEAEKNGFGLSEELVSEDPAAVSNADTVTRGRPNLPKKHSRSTGTISDDAFFEMALEEVESEHQHTNEDGSGSANLEEEIEVMLEEKLLYRESLPPPPPTSVMFEEYFDASKPGEIHLGRPLELKESHKTFGATLWMYENNSASHPSEHHHSESPSGVDGKEQSQRPQFPLTIEKILPLLEVIGMDNNRLVGKLKEFLEFKLPPGFPIRANIPVYPTLSADVTFVNYDAQRVIEDDMFEIPDENSGYEEGFVIRPGGEDDS